MKLVSFVKGGQLMANQKETDNQGKIFKSSKYTI